MTDLQLLQQDPPDAATFAEIVRRHVGWVHGVARRRLRDAHLAEDVAQAVFVLLHRKRPRLDSERALVAWLHRSAWYAAEVAARGERRRVKRETEAVMLRQSQSPSPAEAEADAQWKRLAPVLDELIERLGRNDREAVLLRFYRRMTFTDLAAATGTTEEAARKRVDRAVAKLRRLAGAKGLAMSTLVLTTMLESDLLAAAAPPGLAAATTGAALGSVSAVAAATIPITSGVTTMIAIAKVKLAASVLAGTLVVAGGGAALVVAANAPTSAPASQTSSSSSTTQPAGVANDREPRVQFPKLAPFDAIRWDGETPTVRVRDRWYELLAINDVETPALVTFCKKHYGKIWDERFDEDLVQAMSEMGSPPDETVRLQLRDAESGAASEMRDVPMTRANRQKLRQAREDRERAWPR